MVLDVCTECEAKLAAGEPLLPKIFTDYFGTTDRRVISQRLREIQFKLNRSQVLVKWEFCGCYAGHSLGHLGHEGERPNAADPYWAEWLMATGGPGYRFAWIPYGCLKKEERRRCADHRRNRDA